LSFEQIVDSEDYLILTVKNIVLLFTISYLLTPLVCCSDMV